MLHLTLSIFALLFGACIGSFLNVVIFRWPRDLSVRRPVRSFCPGCEHSIAWHDNLPVLSYMMLRGRCRHCGVPISMQYPLVELTTALVFLLTYDAFFVTRLRLGIGEVGADWPMLVAHWVLWAGMITLAVMDLEAYMVDVRVTWLLLPVGLAGHALWAPAGGEAWIRPGPVQAGWALAVALGLAIGAWLWLRGRVAVPDPAEMPVENDPAEGLLTGESEASSRGRWWWFALPLAVVLGYLAVMILSGEPAAGQRTSTVPGWYVGDATEVRLAEGAGVIRVAVGLVIVFLAMALAASHPQPEADVEIVEALHEEAPDSGRNALWEMKLLAPAAVLGFAVLGVLWVRPPVAAGAAGVLHWEPVHDWQPVWGLATALGGWVIGGAVGWIVRIVFTVALRKEAFGMGDVHILAAAGAIAGWPVAVIGFFLASPLALLGILIIRFRRQSRALPYGPWLALGFLVTSVFQDHILGYLGVRWMLAGR